MKTKSYKITCSLQEGYAPGAKVHKISVAEKVIYHWLTARLHNKQPFVTGLLQKGTLFFPSEGVVIASPTAIFTGELSEPKDMERRNKEVRATLGSLATALKEKLRQEAVFIVYRDQNWCV